ncbi:MAG: hypothetical protein SPL99_01795 [Catonella sp.]|nr:hypothetical protein [Catonella sp.]MDY6356701.1 hypothetical protein [Catonella sp.]
MNTMMFSDLQQDINKVCHTPAVCGSCAGKDCLVGYSKYAIADCKKRESSWLADGNKNIPSIDMRGGYDEDDVLNAIAETLYYCHSCKTDHTDDCLLAITRHAMEIIETGEMRDYPGTPLEYLVNLERDDKVKGSALHELYNNVKAKQADEMG